MAKYKIEYLQEVAKKRGGSCLSTKYINNKQKILWECYFGHKWETSFDLINNRGSWCPYCSAGLYERICRIYFEQIFGYQFKKIKPFWLVNSRNNIMELDGYCEELKLAFEHNGQQHYNEINIFKTNLEIRKEDDNIKIKLCKEYSITLIIIPELYRYTKLHELKDFIKKELIDNNFMIPENYDDVKIDLSKAYIKEDLKRLETMRKYAISKNGMLLSDEYYGWHTHHKWECNSCNYIWSMSPHGLINGKRWCPKCSKKAKSTIEEMHEIAKNRNGKCLSQKYINHHTKLEWECNKCNYIWSAVPFSIKNNNTWCPKCAKQIKPTITEIENLANEKNGKCLNPQEYKNAHSKLTWECDSCSKIWKASYSNIKRGRWCPNILHRKRNKLKRL